MLALVHPFSHPSPDVAHRPPQQKRKSSSSLSQPTLSASASSSSSSASGSFSSSSSSSVTPTASRPGITPTPTTSSAVSATTTPALAANSNTQTQSHHAASSAQHQPHSVLVNTHAPAHVGYQNPRTASAGGAPNGHPHHHHHHQNKPTTPNPRSVTPTAVPSSSSAPPPHPAADDIPPVNIHSYPPTDLLKLLASLLTQIAAANDKLLTSPPHLPVSAASSSSSSPISTPPSTAHYPPIWHTLTTASKGALGTAASTLTFHARNVPTITLEAYLLRILKYCPTTNHVFLSLLVYFDRMSKMSLDATGRTFVIDSYNIHRLVIAGVTVASKFFSDVFYTNSRYAKVGGLPLPELNQLELQFLLLNDFRLVISTAEMQHYANQLILFSHSTRPAPSPATPHVVSSTSLSSTGGGDARRMGAIDAFGGRVPETHALPSQPSQNEQKQEKDWDTRSTSTCSETGDETETEDGETDDEPTIRPARSVADTDSESLRGEGVMDVDGDVERTPERKGRDS